MKFLIILLLACALLQVTVSQDVESNIEAESELENASNSDEPVQTETESQTTSTSAEPVETEDDNVGVSEVMIDPTAEETELENASNSAEPVQTETETASTSAEPVETEDANVGNSELMVDPTAEETELNTSSGEPVETEEVNMGNSELMIDDGQNGEVDGQNYQYESSDPADFGVTPNERDILAFSTDFLVNQGVAAGVLPNTSAWTVTEITSVETKVDGDNHDNVDYRITGIITNADGRSFHATFVVSGAISGDSKEMLEAQYTYNKNDDISYDVSYVKGEKPNVSEYSIDFFSNEAGQTEDGGEEQNVGDYEPYTPSEFQKDLEAQAAFNFGTQFLINQGIQADVLSSTSTWTTQIVTAEHQIVSGINYQFFTGFTDQNNNTFNALYTVYSQSWTNTLEVTDVQYVYYASDNDYKFNYTEARVGYSDDSGLNVTKYLYPVKSDSDANNEFEDFENFNSSPETSFGELEYTETSSNTDSGSSQTPSGQSGNGHNGSGRPAGIHTGGAPTIISNTFTPAPAHSTSAEPTDNTNALPGGYNSVDLNTFQNDTDGQNALLFGTQYVVNQGIIAGVLPNTTQWNVSTLNSVDQQIVSGTYYKFNATISNAEGDKFTAVYVVYSQVYADYLVVMSVEYSYDQQNEGVVEQSGSEWEVSYDADGSLEVDLNDENISNMVAGLYGEVDVAEATNDTSVQELLNQGLQATILQGQEEGILSAGNWTLIETNNIWNEYVSDGVNWRFHVTIQNSDFVIAELEYVVLESYSGGNEVVTSAVTTTNNF